VCTGTAFAQAPIVTTIISVGFVTNTVGGVDLNAITNRLVIPNGQAARVATLNADRETVYYRKSGFTFEAGLGNVVEGPAEFTVSAYGSVNLLTVERWTVRKSK
jgi:hypothetical protein